MYWSITLTIPVLLLCQSIPVHQSYSDHPCTFQGWLSKYPCRPKLPWPSLYYPRIVKGQPPLRQSIPIHWSYTNHPCTIHGWSWARHFCPIHQSYHDHLCTIPRWSRASQFCVKVSLYTKVTLTILVLSIDGPPLCQYPHIAKLPWRWSRASPFCVRVSPYTKVTLTILELSMDDPGPATSVSKSPSIPKLPYHL